MLIRSLSGRLAHLVQNREILNLFIFMLMCLRRYVCGFLVIYLGFCD